MVANLLLTRAVHARPMRRSRRMSFCALVTEAAFSSKTTAAVSVAGKNKLGSLSSTFNSHPFPGKIYYLSNLQVQYLGT